MPSITADLTDFQSTARQVDVTTDPGQLATVPPGWHEIAAAYGPIEQWDWAAACFDTVDAANRPAVVRLACGGNMIALASLVSRRMRGMRRLAQAGVGDLYEPMDLLARDAEAMAALVQSLLRLKRPLWFERLPADSAALPAFQRACRGRAHLLVRPRANCPYIPLDASWREPESHLNSGRRSDLRRAKRKAEQLGKLEFEVLRPRSAELDAWLDEAQAVEARSWKGAAGTALLCDQRRATFYHRYLHQAAESGALRIFFLRIGGQAVAMLLTVEQNEALWLLKIGYDAEFSAVSPGMLITCETIRYAANAGLRNYEFLGRAEAWTRVWTALERQTVAVGVYPYSGRGLAALAVDGAAAALARWRKK